MSTATILQEMERHAEYDEWTAHANAATRLLQAPASTLTEIEPKLRYLAQMIGGINGEDTVAKIMRSVLRDVGSAS